MSKSDDCGPKVAICGKAPSSLGLAPYDDESWQVWTVSDLAFNKLVPRWTRHFELHPLDWFRKGGIEGYFDWMRRVRGKPIYLQELCQEVAAGVLYPKEDILHHFGSRYFTNTVSWMVALAIREGASAISLWGVDMAQDTEYAKQRPSVEYWLGVAAGREIEVYVPAQSDILKTRLLYGFETDSGQMREKWQARTAELKQRMGAKVARRDEFALQAAFLQGALDSQEYYRQWVGEG